MVSAKNKYNKVFRKYNMKYKNILKEATTINDEQFLKKISATPPQNFEYAVSLTGGHYTLKEVNTNIVIFKTTDENYADECCDQFNSDKDVGKDALLNAIKTLYM